MLLLVMSLAVSLVLLAVFCALAHFDASRAWICGLSALTCVGCCVVASTQLVLQGLLTLAATMLVACVTSEPRWIGRGAIAAWLASWIIVLAGVWSHLSTMSALRAEYPLESLADRLHYEHQPDSAQRIAALPPPPTGELAYAWQGSDSSWRSISLKRLHSRYYDDFVIANGFGTMRMGRVGRSSVELPEVPAQELPEPPDDATPDPGAGPRPDDPLRPLAAKTLTDLHSDGLNAFIDRERMGYVESVERAAGFASHRFVRLPAAGDAGGMQSWRITRLELIGTLRHAAPVAYVTDGLPNLEDIAGVPTRDLDPFERHALPQLEQYDTVVHEVSPAQLRMLGAVRAARQCTACHAVAEGTLLGAFSYELHRAFRSQRLAINDPWK